MTAEKQFTECGYGEFMDRWRRFMSWCLFQGSKCATQSKWCRKIKFIFTRPHMKNIRICVTDARNNDISACLLMKTFSRICKLKGYFLVAWAVWAVVLIKIHRAWFTERTLANTTHFISEFPNCTDFFFIFLFSRILRKNLTNSRIAQWGQENIDYCSSDGFFSAWCEINRNFEILISRC